MLKRKIDLYLKEWKDQKDKYPLIIKGARQIGKTKSIEEFSKCYDSVIEINFAIQKDYKDIFDDGFEVDTIIKNISLKNREAIFIPGNTLIFLMKFKIVLIVLQVLSHLN